MRTNHALMALCSILSRTVNYLKPVVSSTQAGGTNSRFNHGSALIGLVAAIVILSVIAAAIVPMVGSSGQQSGLVDQASKAYLMSEAAYRLAASKFLHGGPNSIDQHQILEQLDGNYTLDNNQGRFEMELYAYFYETANDSLSGSTSFKAHCPGTFPGPGAFPDDSDDEVTYRQV